MTTPATGTLRWGVKASFLRYVRVIAHRTSTVTAGARAETEDVFVFPVTGAEQHDGHWVLSFAGAVRFEAHHGFLDVTLSGLSLALGPENGSLSVASAEDRVVIATVRGPGPGLDADPARWPPLGAELTEAGAEVFGGVYPAGTELAPLEVVLS